MRVSQGTPVTSFSGFLRACIVAKVFFGGGGVCSFHTSPSFPLPLENKAIPPKEKATFPSCSSHSPKGKVKKSEKKKRKTIYILLLLFLLSDHTPKPHISFFLKKERLAHLLDFRLLQPRVEVWSVT